MNWSDFELANNDLRMKKSLQKIQVFPPDGRVYEKVLDEVTLTIGRSADNDIVFYDPKVSRHHAKIEKKGKKHLVADLGSFNGIYVNGNKINTANLQMGDEICIGSARIVFGEKKKKPTAAEKKVELSEGSEYENWHHHTIRISPRECTKIDSQDLFSKVDIVPEPKEKARSLFSRSAKQKVHVQPELNRLERMNKVLYVLYEISRQMNTIHNFEELLKKIMDLIFYVIDADFGFLILIDEGSGEYVPAVIKFKEDRMKGKIRASRTLVDKVVQDRVGLLTTNAMKDSRLVPTESLIQQNIRSAICVPLWQKENIIGVIQLDSTRLHNQFSDEDLELLKAIGCQMSMVLEQAKLNEKIREEEELRNRLQRYHSPQVVDMIIQASQEKKGDLLEAKDVSVTILFTDIIGFTRISEKMTPREVNLLLNLFFSKMTDVIFEFEGTLDKYVGDSLMAVFGAPLEKEDDAERAIRAALKMRQELAVMKENVNQDKRFDMRIGINTGRVVAGNIGSPKRMDYTVIGDPVNIASRLESIAEPNQILIGEETFKNVKGKFPINKIGEKVLRGRSMPIVAYEVLGE